MNWCKLYLVKAFTVFCDSVCLIYIVWCFIFTLTCRRHKDLQWQFLLSFTKLKWWGFKGVTLHFLITSEHVTVYFSLNRLWTSWDMDYSYWSNCMCLKGSLSNHKSEWQGVKLLFCLKTVLKQHFRLNTVTQTKNI